MPHPPQRNLPFEVFGFNTGAEPTPEIKRRVAHQHCPFLDSECKKPRKSEPQIRIGSCIVGCSVDSQIRPIIICPHRFDDPVVFNSIEREFFPSHQGKVTWVPEVKLGKSGGSVDYVATVFNGDEVQHFACVEVQSGGTTGSPWNAVKHFRDNLTLDKVPSVTFGINWANEFIKTMMQQLNKKGSVITRWKTDHKIVVVLQDGAMDYILKQGQGIGPFREEDPFQFRLFSPTLDPSTDQWILQPSDRKYSANLAGIRRALTSQPKGAGLSERQFIEQIRRRNKASGK